MNTLKKTLSLAALVLSVFTVVHAQAPDAAGPPQAAAPATALPPLTEAEVRKVDKEASKLTLRHGPIVNLDMPAMTMVFRVADPAFLEAVKPGDKIHVHIEKVGGQFTVTRIDTAR